MEGVLAELQKFQTTKTTVNIDISLAIFSNEIKYVTKDGTTAFNALEAER